MSNTYILISSSFFPLRFSPFLPARRAFCFADEWISGRAAAAPRGVGPRGGHGDGAAQEGAGAGGGGAGHRAAGPHAQKHAAAGGALPRAPGGPGGRADGRKGKFAGKFVIFNANAYCKCFFHPLTSVWTACIDGKVSRKVPSAVQTKRFMLYLDSMDSMDIRIRMASCDT
eukprot:scaffold302266_cov28-Prasinocladus_malaysianus.AAC.1